MWNMKNGIKIKKGAEHFKWRNSGIFWRQKRYVKMNENIKCDTITQFFLMIKFLAEFYA